MNRVLVIVTVAPFLLALLYDIDLLRTGATCCRPAARPISP